MEVEPRISFQNLAHEISSITAMFAESADSITKLIATIDTTSNYRNHSGSRRIRTCVSGLAYQDLVDEAYQSECHSPMPLIILPPMILPALQFRSRQNHSWQNDSCETTLLYGCETFGGIRRWLEFVAEFRYLAIFN